MSLHLPTAPTGGLPSLIAAAHRAQADALEIEAQAKRRLADEYDAAQERGAVALGSPKTIPSGNSFAIVNATNFLFSSHQLLSFPCSQFGPRSFAERDRRVRSENSNASGS